MEHGQRRRPSTTYPTMAQQPPSTVAAQPPPSRSGGRSVPSPSPGRGGPRAPSPGRGGPSPQPQALHPASSLPHGCVPAYLPGSAALVEELDQRLLVVLRDGRHILGTLASFDQFSNLVLLDAVERRILPPSREDASSQNLAQRYYYTDVDLGGVYCLRGENMVLLGRVAGNDDDGAAATGGVRLDGAEWEQRRTEREQAQRTGAGTGTMAPIVEWDFDSDLVV